MTKKKRIEKLEERVSDLELELALLREEIGADTREKKGVSTRQIIDEWVNGEEAAHE